MPGRQPILGLLALGVMAALIIGSCKPVDAPEAEPLSGTVSISGAFALYPLVMRWVEEFQDQNPGVIFDVYSEGTGKGIDEVLAGDVNIAMISRKVSPKEEAEGVYSLSVAKDAVFAVVNKNNPVVKDLMVRGATREALRALFITGAITTWGQVVGNPAIADTVHVYTRSDACGAANTWGSFLGGTQKDLVGEGRFGDPDMVQAVHDDPLGIGYNDLIYAYGLGEMPANEVAVLPIDLNGNGRIEADELLDTRDKAVAAVASAAYPAPPARFLHLVTKGKPDGIVRIFLEWVLTEGQKDVERAGYVRLSDAKLKAALEKIR